MCNVRVENDRPPKKEKKAAKTQEEGEEAKRKCFHCFINMAADQLLGTLLFMCNIHNAPITTCLRY